MAADQKHGRGFSAIGLWMPKTRANVGSALRAADCYGASLVAIEGERYRRSPTDTTQAWRRVPVVQIGHLLDAIPYDAVPVAVELVDGAQSIVSYTHPERAFYVFGPEDGSLSPGIVAKCRDVIYVPTTGCMNLAAAVNVVLYDRRAKQIQRAATPHPPFTCNAVRATRQAEREAQWRAKEARA